MATYRYGALHVVETAADTDVVQRELKQIDDRLWLERQITLDGDWVWCVMCDLPGDQPPLTVFEWRGPDGEAIPVLSSGIVDRMNQVERDPHVLNAKVKAANEEFTRLKAERYKEEIYGRAEEYRRAGNMVQHRSPAFVRAKRIQRRMGHNV
jgi:hypothetical protein